MTAKATTRLARAVAIVSFLMIAGDLWMIANSPDGLPFSHPERSAVIDYLEPLIFLVVGLVIAWKRPDNRVGWLILAYAGGRALLGFLGAYGERGVLYDPGSLPGAGFAVWTVSWTWIAHLILLPLTLLFFPSGDLPSSRWRWAVWCCLIPPALMVGAAVGWWNVSPRTLITATEANLPGPAWTGTLFLIAFAVAIGLAAISVASLFVRYRRSHGEQRQQLKWVLFTAAVLVAQGIQSELTSWEDFDTLVGAFLFAAVPAAMGVAILKHRLYDIDRIINRALVYGLLTAALGLVYVLIVVTLQGLTDPLTGSNQVAIAASTLLVAALFRPARARIQRFIDRYFYRSRYDASQILERFTVQLRDRVDLEGLKGELLATVGQTVRPAHVSLWLRQADEAGTAPSELVAVEPDRE